MTLHSDRRRANSFGAAAARYDRHRPRYPRDLLTAVVTAPGPRVLDVGAGTGIASAQLAELGADVLAVEPDAQMAAVASAKGIAVEVAPFEQWDAAGRTFDAVVFAQSFHWVDPEPALAKVTALLRPGGCLALLWNRILAVDPGPDVFAQAFAGIVTDHRRPSVAVEDTVVTVLNRAGFAPRQHRVVEDLHYTGPQWVDMVTTYSNVLTLPADRQTTLRARLLDCVGPDGVTARNDALAVLCTRAEA